MGEKKAYTCKSKSATTFRNNYYIHKKYPIKIIDVCGFSQGDEGKINKETIMNIYSEKNNNIIIDEYINHIFSLNKDRRDNIHLLLYFNVYKEKYDIIPGELPLVNAIKEKEIPIIFIVNKCDDEFIFKSEDKMEEDELEILEDIKKEIKDSRKDLKGYEKYETIFLNCLNKNGFDNLLLLIFEKFKQYKMSSQNLDNIKQMSLSKNNLGDLVINSYFFKNQDPYEIALKESLLKTVIEVRKLSIKYYGHFTDKFQKINYFLFFIDRFKNYAFQNSNDNCFPLLTSLISQIYKHFGMNDKTEKDCNEYIKKKYIHTSI